MSENGLIHALLLDGKGGAKTLDIAEIGQWQPDHGNLWLHFDYSVAAARDWILNQSQLDPIVSEALLTEETRPRTTSIEEGLLMALRGVNLNPGSELDDMVSIRLWVDEHRIISTRKRDLLSVGDMVHQLEKRKGPKNTAEFISELSNRLVWRMSDCVDAFEDKMAELEDEVLSEETHNLRLELAELRRHTITIRRYLSPQKEALSRLLIENMAWFPEGQKHKLREVNDRLIRHIEDIDAVRERAAVTQEELQNQVSEQLNSRLYLLSIISAIFLPLGFFTGLLGINVGGIPGAENASGFLIFSGFIVLLLVLQLLFFRWKKWL